MNLLIFIVHVERYIELKSVFSTYILEPVLFSKREYHIKRYSFFSSFSPYFTGNAEEHATLSRALSQLAEVEEKIEQLHLSQVYTILYLTLELTCQLVISIRTL